MPSFDCQPWDLKSWQIGIYMFFYVHFLPSLAIFMSLRTENEQRKHLYKSKIETTLFFL